MNRPFINIKPRPETDKPLEAAQSSRVPSAPQSSSVSNTQKDKLNKHNPNSWIHDYDKDGKSSKDIVVEWMLAKNNWKLYNDSETPKSEETENQTVMVKQLNQLLIDRGHISRSVKNLKETIRYLKKTFIATYNKAHPTESSNDPEDDVNNTTEDKAISIFKWYSDLLPLFGSIPVFTDEGLQSSIEVPVVIEIDDQSDDEDAHSINLSNDNDDDGISFTLSDPDNIFSQEREKKRIIGKQSESSDSYTVSSKKRTYLEDLKLKHEKEKMQIKRQKHWLRLKNELRRKDIDDEDREMIKIFINDIEEKFID